MAWLKFVDKRPAYKFAITCGKRNFHFLFNAYPDDAMQCVSVAVTEYPDIGKPLAAAVVRELGHLATALGWRRMPTETKARPWRYAGLSVTQKHLGKFNGENGCSVFISAPLCGTMDSYRKGCRCAVCRSFYAKNRPRKKTLALT